MSEVVSQLILEGELRLNDGDTARQYSIDDLAIGRRGTSTGTTITPQSTQEHGEHGGRYFGRILLSRNSEEEREATVVEILGIDAVDLTCMEWNGRLQPNEAT